MPESIFDMPAARMAGQGWLLQPETDAEKLVLLPPSETSTLMLEPETLPETLSGGPGFIEWANSPTSCAT